MKNLLVLISTILLVTTILNAQVVITDPVFPTDNDSVKVIFNAEEGNKGLEGFTDDIWAHTGVITNLSSSSTDWKYVIAGWSENIDKGKLISRGNNIWELNIGPSIRTFYNVPETEIIINIAFVFRNSDGTKSGRMEDGSDIFANVFEAGLNVSIIQPSKEFIVVNPGGSINIEIKSTGADSISMFKDSAHILTVLGNELNTNLIAEGNGQHFVEARAYSSIENVNDSFSYFVLDENNTEDLPIGVIDGINYISDNTVILVLFAPEKEIVFAIGDFNNWQIDSEYLMKKTPDGDRYWIQINDLIPQKEYIFQYFIDGEIRIADPYADKLSDPWNDKYINSTTYPDLIAYPDGKTTQIASVLQTAQEEFNWELIDFIKPDKTNLVIYELLIRDFSSLHSFSCLSDTLNYIENLGVNAIELMPVSEFEGNESWGYNSSFYFAVDKYYGHKNELKTFIDECHKRGIAVIIDMVLNHSYGQSPLVRMYWDGENNQPAANNPWFNQVSPNTMFSWGYDFNHESEATKAFVDSVNKYWIKEYKVDGFRFDFTKGFTNTTGNGGSFDISRVNILKRMADVIWSEDPDSYVILEHFATNAEEKLLSDYGMMLWGNSNYNYGEAGMAYFENNKSDFSWISYKKRNWNNPNLVAYMESHDEERLTYKFTSWGNTQNPDYSIRSLTNSLERMELNANFFIPVPGPKMIWMFGELGYDYSIDFNGRVGNKPVRWDYFEVPGRKRLYQVYSALNKLKQNYPVFQTDDYNISFTDTVKQIKLNHAEMKVNILGNFGIYPSTANPDFDQTGWWYEYWSGDSIEVSNLNQNITMEAGQYLFYTDVKLNKPDLISGIQDPHTLKIPVNIKIYPNPAKSYFYIKMGPNQDTDYEISLYDLSGRAYQSSWSKSQTSQQLIRVNTEHLTPGIYLVDIHSPRGRCTSKIIIQNQ